MASQWPARDLVGYGGQPPHPQWPGNAKLALSLCLNYEEGGEYETALGDAHSESYLGEIAGRAHKTARDPSIESEFDYGSRAGVWRVLKMLDEAEMKCTVWGVGKALERNPGVAKAMAGAGHEVAGHGYRWINNDELSEEEETAQIEKQLDIITETTGIPPSGHYVGRHSLATLTLLEKAHKKRGIPLLYSSDTYADDLPYYVPSTVGDGSLLMIPYALDNNDFRFGISNNWSSPDDFLTHLKHAFDYLYEEGENGSPKMMSVGIHARISGKPARAYVLRQFLRYVKSKEGVWVATRKEIAEHWRNVHPAE